MKYETLDVSGLVEEFVEDFLQIIRTNVELLLRAQLNAAAGNLRRRAKAEQAPLKRGKARPQAQAADRRASGKHSAKVRGRKAKKAGRKKPEQLTLFG